MTMHGAYYRRMDIIDIKAAKMARKWDQVPQSWSDSDIVQAVGQTLWFAQVKLNICAAELLRPLTRPVRRVLRLVTLRMAA